MGRQRRKSLSFFTLKAADGKIYGRPLPTYNQN